MSGHEPDLDPANDIYSTHSVITTHFKVENNSTDHLHVYELTREPRRRLVGKVGAGSSAVFPAAVGTPFVIKDLKTGFYQLAYAEPGGRNIELRDEDIDKAFWYDDESARGWSINVCKDLAPRDPSTRRDVLEFITKSIDTMERLIPPVRLAQIKKVSIWVELNNGFGSTRFHHDEVAMTYSGFDAFKMGGVEISNSINLLKRRADQPFALLHEFANALHHLSLTGAEKGEVKAAFKNAVSSRKYESVRHKDGSTRPAMALANEYVFFAELTESFFGENDFEPFHRTQLAGFDPESYQMVKTIWKV